MQRMPAIADAVRLVGAAYLMWIVFVGLALRMVFHGARETR
jgi:threonine/homoserine/homoserine lactone efflux protein